MDLQELRAAMKGHGAAWSRVESRPGEGTTVSGRIPARAADEIRSAHSRS
jgi:hypothetical protein